MLNSISSLEKYNWLNSKLIQGRLLNRLQILGTKERFRCEYRAANLSLLNAGSATQTEISNGS